MSWYAPSPKPSRHYAIRTRRCRQRAAQRLGAGMAVEQVTAIERLQAGEIEALLGDAGFAALVAHYRELAALPEDERRRRLVEQAFRLLELGLGSGDLRVAMFVLHEEARGQSPAEALADAVLRADAASARVPVEAAPTRRRSEREPLAAAPFTPPPEPRLTGSAEADFAACAAVQPDAAAAEALAMAELGRVGHRLAAVRGRLVQVLRGELERAGTAGSCVAPDPPVAPLAGLAHAFARHAHAEPARGFGAARELDGRRMAFRAGDPPAATALFDSS